MQYTATAKRAQEPPVKGEWMWSVSVGGEWAYVARTESAGIVALGARDVVVCSGQGDAKRATFEYIVAKPTGTRLSVTGVGIKILEYEKRSVCKVTVEVRHLVAGDYPYAPLLEDYFTGAERAVLRGTVKALGFVRVNEATPTQTVRPGEEMTPDALRIVTTAAHLKALKAGFRGTTKDLIGDLIVDVRAKTQDGERLENAQIAKVGLKFEWTDDVITLTGRPTEQIEYYVTLWVLTAKAPYTRVAITVDGYVTMSK